MESSNSFPLYQRRRTLAASGGIPANAKPAEREAEAI